MRRQKNVPNERTEQNSRKRTEQNRDKQSTRSDTEFKTLVLRIFNKLGGRITEFTENFNKVIGNIKAEIEKIKKELVRNEGCSN